MSTKGEIRDYINKRYYEKALGVKIRDDKDVITDRAVNLIMYYYDDDDIKQLINHASGQLIKESETDTGEIDAGKRLSSSDIQCYEEAVQLLEKYQATSTYDDEYWNSLGNAYYGTRKYDKAEPCYKKAIGLKPNNQTYHNNLENCMRARKMLEFEDKIENYPKKTSFVWNEISGLVTIFKYTILVVAFFELLGFVSNPFLNWFGWIINRQYLLIFQTYLPYILTSVLVCRKYRAYILWFNIGGIVGIGSTNIVYSLLNNFINNNPLKSFNLLYVLPLPDSYNQIFLVLLLGQIAVFIGEKFS
jgi:tetratricopeptide (TPR) repeat protein